MMFCVAGCDQRPWSSPYSACYRCDLRLLLRLPFPRHRGLAVLRVQVQLQTLHHLHSHQRDRQSAQLYLQLSLLLFSRSSLPANVLLHGRVVAESLVTCRDVKVRGLPVLQRRREFFVQTGAQDDKPSLIQLQQRGVVVSLSFSSFLVCVLRTFFFPLG